jgi:hypothetical protein
VGDELHERADGLDAREHLVRRFAAHAGQTHHDHTPEREEDKTMSPNPRMPDPAARWTSHLIVGFAASAAVGRKTSLVGSIVAALAAVAAHEALDAQLVVQLLKLHRNTHFAEDLGSRPASILLTTLAGHAYTGERDVYDAMVEIVDEMPQLVEHHRDVWVVANPVEPRENFADKWGKDPSLATGFFDWMERAAVDLREAGEQRGLQRLTTRLAESFGEEPIQKSAKRLGSGYRDASAAGVMALSAATGRLSRSGSVPVKRHGFYGETRPPR